MIFARHDSVYAFANPTLVRFIHKGLWGYWNSSPNDMDKKAYSVKALFDILHNAISGDGLFTTLMANK